MRDPRAAVQATRARPAFAVAIVLGIGAAACGEEPLTVAGVVRISNLCTFEADRTRLVASPRFDIANGGTAESSSCEHPFVVQLLVDNGNTNAAAVDEAEVMLRSVNDAVLDFAGELPNPFRVAVSGALPGNQLSVLPVEIIPAAHAEYLDAFVGQKVRTEISLLEAGVVATETTVDVEICDGCLTRCESEASDKELDNPCNDAALGAEATICLDPKC